MAEDQKNQSDEVAQYFHGEAFMLMRYRCPCGHSEIFWNSRDGVTPFAMCCPSCGDPTLRHDEWKSDLRVPDYSPHPGQGIWRDGTPDEAEAIIRRRLEGIANTPMKLSSDRIEKLVAICRDPDHKDNTEFQRGWPILDRLSG